MSEPGQQELILNQTADQISKGIEFNELNKVHLWRRVFEDIDRSWKVAFFCGISSLFWHPS